MIFGAGVHIIEKYSDEGPIKVAAITDALILKRDTSIDSH